MKKFLISGSSASAGYGLTEEDKATSFWPTSLVETQFPNGDIINTSIIGSDNAEIFNQTYADIKTGNFSHAMVTWSVIPRTNVNYGFELYRTASPYVSFSHRFQDIHLVNDQKITPKTQEKQKFNVRYYNYHWDILDLVVKCNLLIDIARQYSCRVGFVNFYLPWKNEQFFQRIEWITPSELGELSQEILVSECRDDSETKLLYDLMHSSYEKFGGIQETHWLNLYDPIYDHQIDFVDEGDKGHPGPKSQSVIAKMLQPRFNQVFA
jgi:hypothetical protein